VSLDKVESSNPNLKAVHAGGKLGACSQMLRMLQMPKEGCFAFSRLASHIRYSPSRGEKPALLRKTTISRLLKVVTGFFWPFRPLRWRLLPTTFPSQRPPSSVSCVVSSATSTSARRLDDAPAIGTARHSTVATPPYCSGHSPLADMDERVGPQARNRASEAAATLVRQPQPYGVQHR
jgi:hypothetical protein